MRLRSCISLAAKRLAAARLTVVDATNVQEEARKPLVALAREYHCLPVAIVFDLPEKICQERNRGRADRNFGPHVIQQQSQQLRRSMRKLEREGFRHVFMLSSPEEVDAATIERQPLWNNRADRAWAIRYHRRRAWLLRRTGRCCWAILGYSEQPGGDLGASGGSRKLVFVGDLVDRGPKIPEVVRLVMESVKAGTAFCVPGNHDIKFMRAIWGKDVQIKHGLAESLQQFEAYEQHYRGFSRSRGGVHRFTRQPLRFRRWPAGRGACGDEGIDAGTRIGQGA